MKRDEDLLFYARCWKELRSFLAEVVRDEVEASLYAKDILKLMRSIERKYER